MCEYKGSTYSQKLEDKNVKVYGEKEFQTKIDG